MKRVGQVRGDGLMGVVTLIGTLVLALTLGWTSLAAAQTPERAPIPDWVKPLVETAPPAPDATPYRVLTIDRHVLVDGPTSHDYSRLRTRAHTGEGVRQIGTVMLPWNPASQTLTVHHVRIIRGDQEIDALAGDEFEIIRREENLANAMLDGVLTAVLQPRDLRVGDILDVAASVASRDPSLGGHVEGVFDGNLPMTIDNFRQRVLWPRDRPMSVRARAPWVQPTPRRIGDRMEIEIVETAMASATVPTLAPARFSQVRQLEVSDFRSWAEVSALMEPLYVQAARLEPDSPLQAEIDRIAAAHDTPADRAMAALRLVQDEVRYVALSMGVGNLVPATADETWRRRFGDCKAKTALLLALLNGLGIPAEASLISIENGDGMDERLPLLGLFDHVVVRTEIDGQVLLLDGTRSGDRILGDAPVAGFAWTLPLRAEGGDLDRIVQPRLSTASMMVDITMDASAGLDAPARLRGDVRIGGEGAALMNQWAGSMSPEQMQETLRDITRPGADETADVDAVEGVYDAGSNTYSIILDGTDRLSWWPTPGGRRQLQVEETAITASRPELRAASDQAHADLPYAVAHPVLTASETRIVLPGGGEGFTVDGDDVDRTYAGVRYQRTSRLENGVLTVSIRRESLVSELSAAEVREAREAGVPNVAQISILAPPGYRATEADQLSLTAEQADVTALLRRAQVLRARGDIAGAAEALDRAVEADPEDVRAHILRGSFLRDQGEFAASRVDLEKAAELAPQDANITQFLGSLAYDDQRYEDAVVEFSVLARIPDRRAQALASRAETYTRLGRTDRALADYRAAAALDPGAYRYGEWRLRLATERDAVRSEADARLAEEPTDPSAMEIRTWIAREDGRLDQALAVMDAAVAADPEEQDLRIMRAGFRGLSGDLEGAEADLSSVRTDTQDAQMLNNLCWSAAEFGYGLEQGLADCDAALALAPHQANIHDSRALVLLQMGRLDEALEAYNQALTLAPRLGAALYGRGLTRQAMGDAGGQEDIDTARIVARYVEDPFVVYLQRRGD